MVTETPSSETTLPLVWLEKPTIAAWTCWRCELVIAEEITAPYRVKCKRCNAINKRVK